MEKLLSVFDQGDQADSQILNVREEDYPEKYGEVVRRLQRAVSEPDIRRSMDMEDEIVEELQNQERVIALKDKELEKKSKTIEEKDKALEGKDEILQENRKELNEKNRQIQELMKRLNLA